MERRKHPLHVVNLFLSPGLKLVKEQKGGSAIRSISLPDEKRAGCG
jgi:hypothetical protein